MISFDSSRSGILSANLPALPSVMIIITDGRAGKFSDNIPDLELSNNIVEDVENFFEA